MQNREKIAVDVTGTWHIDNEVYENTTFHFTFYAEPELTESIKLRNEIAELLGGREELVKLEQQARDFYEKFVKQSVEKFGEEEYSLKYNELKNLPIPKTEEETAHYNKLSEELFGQNPNFDMYSALIGDRLKLGEYAYLKVMCVEKPEGFEFFKQTERELNKIVKAVEEKIVERDTKFSTTE